MEHKIVSQEEWLEASRELLKKEKEFTRARDAMSEERRKLPWVKVTAHYVFETTEGRKTLADLFGKNSQLIVYHFMFGPGWKEGCSGCSFVSDHVDGALPHLVHHNVSFVAVSRAPLEEFLPYKKRMGWKFPWVSSAPCDFNRDFQVSFTEEGIKEGFDMYNFEKNSTKKPGETPGLSVFYKDQRGDIFRTYSSYARGLDMLVGAYNWLDLTPKGRNEKGNMGSWMKRHDEYESTLQLGLGSE
jgi:predicted dithiol-disulfide oxidoreductase (DUF899 family)